ncbi:MAG: LCCL domain-containing protein [bacterium]
MTFICPKGCKTLTNLKVYGGTKQTFGEESSICRAGLYMGILKDNEES